MTRPLFCYSSFSVMAWQRLVIVVLLLIVFFPYFYKSFFFYILFLFFIRLVLIDHQPVSVEMNLIYIKIVFIEPTMSVKKMKK